jgi:hypothetical protein
MNVADPDCAYGRGEQIFQKPRCHLKILDAIRWAWIESHTEDSQMSGTTIRNLVSQLTGVRDLCTPGIG